MPIWVCPYCRAQMHVSHVNIGQTQTCPKCGNTSEITDVNIASSEPASRVSGRNSDFLEAHTKLTISKEVDDNVSGVALALLGAVFGISLGGGSALFGIGQRNLGLQLIVVAGAVGVLLVILRPFYIMANDTRINLRLLEELIELQTRKNNTDAE